MPGLVASAGIAAKSTGTGRMIQQSVGIRLIVEDSFTDVDGTLLPAHNIAPTNLLGLVWQNVDSTSNASISGNVGVESLGAGTVILNTPKADFMSSATFTTVNSIAFVGLIGRCVDASNEWRLGYNASATVLSILERVAGVNTTRGSVSTISKTGVTFNLIGTMQGSNVSVQRVEDGVTASYGNATSLSTITRHGWRFGTTGGYTIDNFKLTQ